MLMNVFVKIPGNPKQMKLWVTQGEVASGIIVHVKEIKCEKDIT